MSVKLGGVMMRLASFDYMQAAAPPSSAELAEYWGPYVKTCIDLFGAGPVGLFAARSAWLFGAGRVIVVDHLPYRLEFARQFARCEVVNFREVRDMALHLKKLTDGLGPDVAIDAVGAEAAGSALQRLLGVRLKLQAGAATALHWAIGSVRKGGHVSIVEIGRAHV